MLVARKLKKIDVFPSKTVNLSGKQHNHWMAFA